MHKLCFGISSENLQESGINCFKRKLKTFFFSYWRLTSMRFLDTLFYKASFYFSHVCDVFLVDNNAPVDFSSVFSVSAGRTAARALQPCLPCSIGLPADQMWDLAAVRTVWAALRPSDGSRERR